MWKEWKRVYILTLKTGILYLNMITDPLVSEKVSHDRQPAPPIYIFNSSETILVFPNVF
jgi:hypothetical protein